MQTIRCLTIGFILAVSGGAVATAARGEGRDQPQLYKAYFLEHQAKDFAAARRLYEGVASSAEAGDLKQLAQAGADRCRDELAAADFASLMPAESVVFVELNRPGEVFEKLAGMLGLSGKNMRSVLDQRPNEDSQAPFHLPKEISISPSLFEVLGGFGGLAVAVTQFDPRHDGPPTGVMVVHHGDVAIFKGLLETAFQFAPTGQKVQDLPTFSVQLPGAGRILGVLTEKLFIVGSTRELVEGVVTRLTGSSEGSLGARPDLKEVLTQRKGASLFGYVDIQAALKMARPGMSERDQREMAVANALVDLNSLRWATYTAGIQNGALGAQFVLRLADDHHSIAYNLLRLPPMSRRCLEHVPAGAAGFIGFGLNPAVAGAAMDAVQKTSPGSGVTGFDIGRELFGNIQELCAFVVPGKMMPKAGEDGPGKIPNVGIILMVNDVAKSRDLWNQLLAIPGLLADERPIRPKQLTIDSTEVTAYAIPNFGSVYMTELDHCIALGLTRTALKAAIRTHGKQDSILQDQAVSEQIGRMPADSSVMVVGHVGRLAGVAAGAGGAGPAMAAGQAADLCSKTVAWLGVGQSPNQLTLQWSITGLPNVNDALKKYGPMVNTLVGMAKFADHHAVAKKNRPNVSKRIDKRRLPDREPAPSGSDED